ncbi:MAG: hypothetical protein ABI554_15100, partial [Flavobacterium sp.]
HSHKASNPLAVRITKVEGPFDGNGKLVEKITLGTSYVFKATPTRKPTASELPLLKWSVKLDDDQKEIILGTAALNKTEGDKIIIHLKLRHNFEKARVYAFYQKADDSVSVEFKLAKRILQNIVIIGTQNHRGDTALDNPKSWVMGVGSGSKLMFAHQAIRRVRMNKDAKFAVLMCEDGYDAEHLKAVKDAVINLYGGEFYQVNSAQQIINYINSGDKTKSGISEARNNNKVKQLFFYGHGLVGEIALGMGKFGDFSDYAFGAEEALKLSTDAFNSNSHIYSFACRTGLGNPDIDKSIYKKQIKSSTSIGLTSMGIPLSHDEFETVKMPLYSAQSIAQKISNQTNATVYAYLRRSDYEETLFTKDELCFSDYMKIREGDKNIKPNKERCGNKYDYLLSSKYKLTEEENKRWSEWKSIESNLKKVAGAFFDPDGARHNVKAAPSPVGVPADMQTFKPITK